MINSISFGSNNYSDYDLNNFAPRSSNNTRARQPQSDSCSFTTKKAKGNNKKAKLTPSQRLALLLAGIFGAGTVAGGGTVAIVDAVKDYQPKPEASSYHGEITDPEMVDYIASLYDTSAEIILDYNGYETAEEAVGANSLKIAKEYKPFDERLADLQSKMFDADLSKDEKATLQTEIDYMLDKMQKQDESAIAYQDGKYIYFEIKKDIYAEEFKDIWGIKDESIRENNYDLIDDQGEFVDIHAEDGAHLISYKDYTGAVLPEGVTIKIPVRDCGFEFMSFYSKK